MKTRKQLLFFLLFTILGFITLQIPFTKLAGSNVSFTLFDFFGPIAGAFLGSMFGVVSVAAVEIFNIIVHHTPITVGVIIRLFPTLFATYYFAVLSKKKVSKPYILIVPVAAIVLFVLNPIGRTVWYYSLFWTIPLLSYMLRDNVIMRSLGATFTAHAVGGAAWIWAFNLPAAVWKGLIPTVIEERMLFTFGIALSYYAMREALKFLAKKKVIPSLESLSPSF
ncbi:MAG TPA: hypothetical protein VLF68_01260 [Candidatus Saccharimonadales bacterium]|nr:hypothetical protein [Candidatus Saccharimonadales bacterium]